MKDPTRPDPLGVAAARDLERRVEALERANQLLSSSILGGSLIVNDDAGVEIGRIGRLASGFDGLRVQTAALEPVLEADQERGMVVPWLMSPWYGSTGWTLTTTSATFVTMWETATELLFSYELLFRVRVKSVDASTTGEIEIVHAQSSTVMGGTTKVIPAASDAFYEFRYIHGITMNSGPHTFQLKAKRTAGAGGIEVYNPYPFCYGGDMTPVAGGWV